MFDFLIRALQKVEAIGVALVNLLDAAQRNPTPAFFLVLCFFALLAFKAAVR